MTTIGDDDFFDLMSEIQGSGIGRDPKANIRLPESKFIVEVTTSDDRIEEEVELKTDYTLMNKSLRINTIYALLKCKAPWCVTYFDTKKMSRETDLISLEDFTKHNHCVKDNLITALQANNEAAEAARIEAAQRDAMHDMLSMGRASREAQPPSNGTEITVTWTEANTIWSPDKSGVANITYRDATASFRSTIFIGFTLLQQIACVLQWCPQVVYPWSMHFTVGTVVTNYEPLLQEIEDAREIDF